MDETTYQKIKRIENEYWKMYYGIKDIQRMSNCIVRLSRIAFEHDSKYAWELVLKFRALLNKFEYGHY